MTKSKQPGRPTSIDVARLAGVSHTTVSFVINNVTTAKISEETRMRVLEAIAQLDYHPHEPARSLRNRASHIIGVAVPEVYNEHYQELSVGIERYLKEHGYHIFLSITNFHVEEELRCLQWLKQQRFDGLIISPGTGSFLHDDVRQLCEQGYVVTGLGFTKELVDSARVEPISGERQLLEHLIALGHTKIGYIYGVANDDLNERLNSCLIVQKELGISVVESWIYHCGPTRDDGYHATQALLRDHHIDARPTALIVVNDLLATAVLAALNEAHIAVPTAMSVASFDNTPLTRYTLPPLTTVDCDAHLIGEHAARMTLERLKNPQRKEEQVQVPAHLVVRGSTGPVPAQNKVEIIYDIS